MATFDEIVSATLAPEEARIKRECALREKFAGPVARANQEHAAQMKHLADVILRLHQEKRNARALASKWRTRAKRLDDALVNEGPKTAHLESELDSTRSRADALHAEVASFMAENERLRQENAGFQLRHVRDDKKYTEIFERKAKAEAENWKELNRANEQMEYLRENWFRAKDTVLFMAGACLLMVGMLVAAVLS